MEQPLYYLCIWENSILKLMAFTPPPSQIRPKQQQQHDKTNLSQTRKKKEKKKNLPLFLWLHPVNIQASHSHVMWDVRSVADGHIQKCMFSLFARKWMCQSWQKFPETASLFNLVFHGWLVGFLLQRATQASDCCLDSLSCPRFTIREF